MGLKTSGVDAHILRAWTLIYFGRGRLYTSGVDAYILRAWTPEAEEILRS